MELNAKEAVVKKELEHLLVRHSLTEGISAIDEIVLNYVLGIIECLDCHDVDETEDVEPFAEMMEAYLPGFGAISVSEVGEWMLTIANKLSQLQKLDSDSDRRLCLPPQEQGSAEDSPMVVDKFSKHSLPALTTHTDPGPPLLEEEAGAHGERRVVQMQSANSDSVATLREVCPAVCTAELLHCLHVSDGDLEGAACLLLYRQESGTAITEKTGSTSRKKSTTGSSLQKDESVKDCILAKYSFVDTTQDEVEHRPELYRKEEKKMIRYREGQVVSTKGERFSEIKKQESQEMKKTYVNLKPQRKYRFH